MGQFKKKLEDNQCQFPTFYMTVEAKHLAHVPKSSPERLSGTEPRPLRRRTYTEPSCNTTSAPSEPNNKLHAILYEHISYKRHFLSKSHNWRISNKFFFLQLITMC